MKTAFEPVIGIPVWSVKGTPIVKKGTPIVKKCNMKHIFAPTEYCIPDRELAP